MRLLEDLLVLTLQIRGNRLRAFLNHRTCTVENRFTQILIFQNDLRDKSLCQLQFVEPRLVFPQVFKTIRSIEHLAVRGIRQRGKRPFFVMANFPYEYASRVFDLGMRFRRAVLDPRRCLWVGPRKIGSTAWQSIRNWAGDLKNLLGVHAIHVAHVKRNPTLSLNQFAVLRLTDCALTSSVCASDPFTQAHSSINVVHTLPFLKPQHRSRRRSRRLQTERRATALPHRNQAKR